MNSADARPDEGPATPGPGDPALPERAPTDAEMARAQAKPPLYRFFRGGMYVVYMAVVVWFCLSIVVSVWQAVWGPAGLELQKAPKIQGLHAVDGQLPTTPAPSAAPQR